MDARADLERIARASLDAVDPRAIVSRSLRVDGHVLRVQGPEVEREFDLSLFPRLFVIGFGKAAAPMAEAAEEALGDRIEKGLVVVKPGHELPLARIRQVPGGHPIPDENSVRAAAEVARLADEADERTLMIVLVSGGGSSLLAAPVHDAGEKVSLADIQETTRQMLACGAAIDQINCIRKHLLLLAGGRLAGRVAPATSISLILSDVVGDDLQTIASGPMSADSTTYAQALSIIEHYGIGHRLPLPVMRRLEEGRAGRVPETPKPGAPELSSAFTFLVGTNLLALRSAGREAARLGYSPIILTSHMAGEAREAARVLAAVARDVASCGTPCAPPACVLAGGETTVTLRGKGRGGRNQEMAISFLAEIVKEPSLLSRVHFLSFSTDGEDGPTDAAGGFASGMLASAVRSTGADLQRALRENDSHTFLREIGGLFITGQTNTNVCDIQIMLVV